MSSLEYAKRRMQKLQDSLEDKRVAYQKDRALLLDIIWEQRCEIVTLKEIERG